MGRTIVTKRDLAQTTPGRRSRLEAAKRSETLGSTPDAGASGATAIPGFPSTEGNKTSEDQYPERLLKYVPAESVALYLTLSGIVKSSATHHHQTAWLWIVSVFVLLFTPLYLFRVARITKRVQVWISTGAYVVWVFAIGGAFATLGWYEPFYGSIALVAVTALIPLIDPDGLVGSARRGGGEAAGRG
jgi:hypothetical protein